MKQGTGAIFKGVKNTSGDTLDEVYIVTTVDGETQETGIATNDKVNANFIQTNPIAPQSTSAKISTDSYDSSNTGVFIGNSITEGNGVVNPANRYSTLTSVALGVTEVNHGIGSSTMQKGTPLNPIGGVNMQDRLSDIPTKTATQLFLVFEFGDNDVGVAQGNYTDTNYMVAYRNSLDNAISKGWDPKEIFLLSPTYFTTAGFLFYQGVNGGFLPDTARLVSYVTATELIALEYGTNYIDLYSGMANNGGSTLLSADSLHPNEKGARYIALRLIASINDALSPLASTSGGSNLVTIINKGGVGGLNIGNNNILATANPSEINMGGSYANSVMNPKSAKIKVVDNAQGTWGIGVSGNQMEYFSATEEHTFQGNINAQKKVTFGIADGVLGISQLYDHAELGIVMVPRGGTVNDFSFTNKTGAEFFLVPTGTLDIQIKGLLTMENNKYIGMKNSGGSVRNVVYLNASDVCYLSQSTLGTIIEGTTVEISVAPTTGSGAVRLDDLGNLDATATPYTKSTINAAYPNAKKGYMVIADNAGATYVKKDNSPTGNWSTFPTVELT